MALAGMADLFGMEMAERLALGGEYEWQKDATRDLFARLAAIRWTAGIRQNGLEADTHSLPKTTQNVHS